MAYALTTDHQHQLIDVRYSHTVSIESRARAYQETLTLLAPTGYRRIMIDYVQAKAQAELFADINAFATAVSSDPVLRQCRIAFVGAPGQQFNTAVEALAEARHYPFRRFHERDPALAWLLTPRAPGK